jgi:heavy metal sensor kinase
LSERLRQASIRARLTLWFSTALAALALVLGALAYLGARRGLLDGLDVTLAESARRSVLSQDIPVGADATAGLQLTRNAPARLLLLDGTPLQSDPAFPGDVEVSADGLARASRGEASFDTQLTFRVHTAPVSVEGRRVAVVQAVGDLASVTQTLVTLQRVLAILLPVTLLLAVAIGWWLAGQALAPAEDIRRRVEQIGTGDLSQRVGDAAPDDEIGRLARTFDGLLARVETAMKREQQFTSDASHELRTPLTVLKAEIEAGLTRPRSNEAHRAALERLSVLADELGVLIDDLLTLARAANHPLRLAPTDLAALARNVVARLGSVAERRGLSLVAPGDDVHIDVMADAGKLSRAITNLVDNAVRYTPQGSVRVSIEVEGSHAVLSVADTGEGIAPEHLPHIFERFYRVNSDRGREEGGTGLGLSIVRAVIEAHAGTLSVQSEVGQGSVFSIRLPRATDAG